MPTNLFLGCIRSDVLSGRHPYVQQQVGSGPILPSSFSHIASAYGKVNVPQLAGIIAGRMQLGQGRTVEELVQELLRPLLREWLDENLPELVDELVKREIERMVEKANR